MASIHAMLRNLAEKVDQVGSRSEHEGLDALEKQVVTLAGRLDAPHSADPALAGLERTMGDLLRQVTALREAAPSEAAVERAARNAVAETLQGSGIATAETGEIGLLRASLADMQARQVASDQRLGATLEGVQSALERLLSGSDPSRPRAARAPSLDERLMSSTSPEAALTAAEGRAVRRRDSAETPRIADDLLEPGSGRPVREPRGGRGPGARADAAGAPVAETGGSRPTSRPASSRRPAVPHRPHRRNWPRRRPPSAADARAQKVILPQATAEEGRFGRLRAEIDRRRRPLLLGLAAIVLALGALQAISMRRARSEPPRVAPASQAAPVREEPAVRRTPQGRRKEGAQEARRRTRRRTPRRRNRRWPIRRPPRPCRTRSRPRRGPPAVRTSVPQVSGMGALQADLGTLPPALAKVKLAALEGDGTAIWDLATREADGRGMPRDLALATKLYEKLAAAGYAPAQYKVAGHYEKGSGRRPRPRQGEAVVRPRRRAGPCPLDAQPRRPPRRESRRQRQAGLRHGGVVVPPGRRVRRP